MTIKQFSEDYVEAKGLKMITLARVTGENVGLLNVHYTMGSVQSFIMAASQMPCLLIKHKPLFRQFFGKVEDEDDSYLLDYWDMSNDWNDMGDRTLAAIKDKMHTNIERFLGGV